MGFRATQRAFSTIELLIASALALMFLSAMFVVTYGDQAMVMTGETNAEAVAKTQAMIEQQQANGRQDFNLVNGTSTVDGIYTKSVTVDLLPDYLTKRVTASTAWKGDHNRGLNVTITTLVTNLDNVRSPNSCNSSLSNPAGWKNPVHYDFALDEFTFWPPPSASGITISGIQVLNKKLYVVASATSAARPENILIANLSTDPATAPVWVGQLDNNPASLVGLHDLAIASISPNTYLYVANAFGSNFGTCSAAANCAQLQVIDVTAPSSPAVVRNFKLGSSVAPFLTGTGGQGVGKSVFYKDGYIYLGLVLAGSGPEFVILDAGGGGAGGTLTNPVYLGGYDLNFTVNSIEVKGDYAYLATTDTASGNMRLMIFNISDKTTPRLAVSPVGGFFTAGGFGVGQAIAVVGTRIYFATAFSGSTIANFYILNGTTPGSYPSALPQYSGTVAGTNDSVNSILVRDNLAYLLTNKQLQVWDVSNPVSPVPWTTDGTQSAFLSLASLSAGEGTAADCEGDYLYLGLKPGVGNTKGRISIVGPGV